MNAWLFAVAAVAGGLGAAVRYVLDGLIRSATGTRFPLGTVVINVTGSFALGVLTGLAIDSAIGHEWVVIGGTGFLGGYTTFSTASFETVRLLQERRGGAALLNAFGTLVACTAAATAGVLLGWRI